MCIISVIKSLLHSGLGMLSQFIEPNDFLLGIIVSNFTPGSDFQHWPWHTIDYSVLAREIEQGLGTVIKAEVHSFASVDTDQPLGEAGPCT